MNETSPAASAPDVPAECPGLRWGIFTFRVPFYHTRVEWPELAQGIFVAGATGLALVPVLTASFGLSFEEAVACVFIHSVLISSAPIVFGEPFAAGWITPALPLALHFVAPTDGSTVAYVTPAERFQVMTAASLNLAMITLLLGVTGLGRRFVDWVPPALKGGIILGAAIAALKRVFLDEAPPFFYHQPVASSLAVGICLLLTFSLPIQRSRSRYRWLAVVAGLGLLPGFLIAAVVGPFVDAPQLTEGAAATKEIVYNIEWGILVPPFAALYEKVSPFAIGWPSPQMFMATLPLALMGYVILFGDIVTGCEVLRIAEPSRPDETIRIDMARTHFSLAIRNALMALFAPFFPTQGSLWTGVHVVIVERWSQGRRAMQSIYSGITSYYVFGIPLLFLVRPVVTALQPLMGIALSLTLALTGFACAYVAMAIPTTRVERGVTLLTAMALVVFSPWVGMIIGLLATLALVGPRPDDELL
ncbi:MAG: hypothetical protein R3C10_05665 [Pirellulales bacterium]|nr:hypothetical protein [Planctomycetales bacterium]